MPWVRWQVARSLTGCLRGARQVPWHGRMDSGPNWPEAQHRSGSWLVTYSIRSSLASRSGSRDSFQARAQLESDAAGVQDLPQPLPPDADPGTLR